MKAALLALVHRAVARAYAFLRDRRAVSTVEYALIVVAVVGIVVAGAGLLGGEFNDMFNDVGDAIGNGMDNLTS